MYIWYIELELLIMTLFIDLSQQSMRNQRLFFASTDGIVLLVVSEQRVLLVSNLHWAATILENKRQSTIICKSHNRSCSVLVVLEPCLPA